MDKRISRRDILLGSAGVVAGLAATSAQADTASFKSTVFVDPTQKSNKRLRFGIIGCGGKGWSGMMQASDHGDIVSLADVDSEYRTKAITEFPRASAFDDYREMLTAMKGKIDAVVISTPDHHHAPAAAMAMKMGLHTYCEKPLTRTIWEARELQRIAKQSGVATQMGNQSTAQNALRKTAALIRSGYFGAIKEIHIWTDRAVGYWPQGIERPSKAVVPKKVDFDLWLGPRPERPFGEGYRPFVWRGWWDFGTGSLGDMGCHLFNLPFMSLDLRDPISVQAETSGHNRESFPSWSKVHYVFGERNGRPQVNVHWYDGGKRPDASLAPGFEIGGNGVIMIFEKGTIFGPNEGNAEFSLVGGAKIPDFEADLSPGHMAEFARAALGGPRAKSDIVAYSGPLTETVLLGNLAIWADGPKLEWDAKRMAVKGNSEFDALIRPKFRPGWSV